MWSKWAYIGRDRADGWIPEDLIPTVRSISEMWSFGTALGRNMVTIIDKTKKLLGDLSEAI
jgi:hypothetical protein